MVETENNKSILVKIVNMEEKEGRYDNYLLITCETVDQEENEVFDFTVFDDDGCFTELGDFEFLTFSDYHIDDDDKFIPSDILFLMKFTKTKKGYLKCFSAIPVDEDLTPLKIEGVIDNIKERPLNATTNKLFIESLVFDDNDEIEVKASIYGFMWGQNNNLKIFCEDTKTERCFFFSVYNRNRYKSRDESFDFKTFKESGDYKNSTILLKLKKTKNNLLNCLSAKKI